jgi:hypothetical protein
MKRMKIHEIAAVLPGAYSPHGRTVICSLLKTLVLTLLLALFMSNHAFSFSWKESLAESSEIAFYVSTAGDDSNDGSLERPFKTLAAARDAVRLVRGNDLEKSYTVWMMGGVYELAETFTLGEADAGTKESPVYYKAYPGENVRILGGVALDRGLIKKVKDRRLLERLIDTDARDYLYSINLKDAGITDYGIRKQQGFGLPFLASELELFIGEEAIMPARWPNQGLIKIKEVISGGSVPRNNDLRGLGGAFKLETDRYKQWENHDGLWVAGFFNHGYAEDSIKVAKLDASENTIKLATPHLYGVQAKPEKNWHGYYFVNVFEEIDLHGEGYLDQPNGVYYFYWDKDIATAEVAVSLLEAPMLALYDTSYITVEGIRFETTRGMGVNIIGGQGNVVKDCSFTNIGTAAVVMGNGTTLAGNTNVVDVKGEPIAGIIGSLATHIYEDTMWNRGAGSDHGVIGCRIHNTGSGGIFLSGGDRATLKAGRSYATNNDISDYNRRYKFEAPGVWMDGVGNLTSHNYIHDSDMFAVRIKGNEHIIEYNKIARVSRNGDDNAAFYLGRDPSERGNHVRYNYFRDIGSDLGKATHAVYNDDGACGTKIYGNTFYNGGKGPTVFYCGGSDLETWNNIFIESAGPPIAGSVRLQTWANGMLTGGLYQTRYEAMNYQQPPFSDYYPETVRYFDESPEIPKRNTFVRNVIYKCDTVLVPEPKFGIEFEDNFITDKDPGFVDAENGNFQLRDSSVVYREIPGFEKVDFEKVGIDASEAYRPTEPKILPLVKRSFNTSMAVELYTIPALAEIRYTLDGSEPDGSSTLYTGPFDLVASGTLKAIAINPEHRKNVSKTSVAKFTKDENSPTAVTGFETRKVRKDRVELIWRPASDDMGVQGYDLYRSDSVSNLVSEANLVKPYRILDESFDDFEALAGRENYYAVVAVDAAGNTSKAVSLSVDVPPADAIPYNDLKLSAQPGQSSILLYFPGERPANWQEIRILRKAQGESSFNPVGQIKKTDKYTGNWYYDRAVEAGKSYDYTVVVVDDADLISKPSEMVNQSVAKLPQAGGWILPKDHVELRGPSIEPSIQNIRETIARNINGHWVKFGPVDFGDGSSLDAVEAFYAVPAAYAGQKTHLRLDAPNGPTIATFVWESTGGFHTFKTTQTNITAKPTGKRSLYVFFEGGGGIVNFAGFRFIASDGTYPVMPEDAGDE